MAKTYINSVKYMVKISFEVTGVVDKPDIVGAIFGQSEGLLGDEMDLKELQKSGKIGRIEITNSNVLGKTRGEILIPSSMDIVQTSLLAAAIESVDKVGPYDSKFEIKTIDDVRGEKRKEIRARAQELLEKFRQNMVPDTTELTESIREGSRTAELKELGPEKVPAGPEAATSNEIIVVEGRADVINLLKNNIKNVVGINGSQIPHSVLELCRGKEITVFVDGDRGGSLIARNFASIAKASFVAKAPDGKEVEELTRKEIIQSLRKKIPVKDFLEKQDPQESFHPKRRSFQKNGFSQKRFPRQKFFPQRGQRGPSNRRPIRGQRRFEQQPFGEPKPQMFEEPAQKLSEQDEQKFLPVMKELKNSLKARIFDEQMNLLKETETKNLFGEIEKTKSAHTIVFDGIITKRLLEAAEKNGIETVVGSKKGKTDKTKVKALTVKA